LKFFLLPIFFYFGSRISISKLFANFYARADPNLQHYHTFRNSLRKAFDPIPSFSSAPKTLHPTSPFACASLLFNPIYLCVAVYRAHRSARAWNIAANISITFSSAVDPHARVNFF